MSDLAGIGGYLDLLDTGDAQNRGQCCVDLVDS